jgi:hypothetical protein
MTSEQKAREEIDRLLEAAGWHVQDLRSVDLQAGRGVALREFPLKEGFEFGGELVSLVLQHYAQFDSRYKGLIPLKQVYVPEPLDEGNE